MGKVYLKFRLEVLHGDYLLFQVIEMDERFRPTYDNQIFFTTENGIELYSHDYPSIYHSIDRICLRGWAKDLDFVPFVDKLGSISKDQMLTALSQFWKWEGFKDDFEVDPKEPELVDLGNNVYEVRS